MSLKVFVTCSSGMAMNASRAVHPGSWVISRYLQSRKSTQTHTTRKRARRECQSLSPFEFPVISTRLSRSSWSPNSSQRTERKSERESSVCALRTCWWGPWRPSRRTSSPSTRACTRRASEAPARGCKVEKTNKERRSVSVLVSEWREMKEAPCVPAPRRWSRGTPWRSLEAAARRRGGCHPCRA